MNVTTPVLIEHSREESKSTFSGEQVPQLVRALILRDIEKACQSFDISLDEIKA